MTGDQRCSGSGLWPLRRTPYPIEGLDDAEAAIGFSVLQLIFGAVAIGMAVVGLLARRTGWWPRRRPAAEPPTDGIEELRADAPPRR
jgi:hypothetical protein